MLLATHSGSFHADEALAVALLRSLPVFKDSTLIRSRDPAELAKADMVVDVGGVYDHAAKRYDHHQRGFFETFNDQYKTKLSSAGLVYKHYGQSIIANKLDLKEDDEEVQILFDKMYASFVEGIDGIDNGITQYAASDPTVKAVQQYSVKTDLSSRVGRLNPAWNEPSNNQVLDANFEKASALAGTEFFEVLHGFAHAWYPARTIVQSAFEGRPSPQYVVFDQFCPWKDHLFGMDTKEEILYVVYPDEAGKWRMQAVPSSPDSFESRKALPEKWRGVRDEELSKLTGVPGCIFVHAAGFIGGHQTKEGAVKLVEMALQEA